MSDPSASRSVVSAKPQHLHTNTSLVDITQSLNDDLPNDRYLNRFFPMGQASSSRKMSQGSSGLGTMTNFGSLSQSGSSNENNDENLSGEGSNNNVNNVCTTTTNDNSNESKL